MTSFSYKPPATSNQKLATFQEQARLKTHSKRRRAQEMFVFRVWLYHWLGKYMPLLGEMQNYVIHLSV